MALTALADRSPPDYSTTANTLDYTTIVIPVTLADKELDPFNDHYKPLNEKDQKNWLACRDPSYFLLKYCG